MAGTKFLSERNDLDMELAMGALVAQPTFEDASKYLKAAHGITVTAKKLEVMKRINPERFEKTRKEIAPQLEQALAGNLLDNALLSTMVQRTAIVRTKELLDEGRVADPSRVARDLADVVAKSVDKKLAVEGRPTTIVENRRPEDILRALEAMGVVQQEPIIEAEVVEEPLELEAQR